MAHPTLLSVLLESLKWIGVHQGGFLLFKDLLWDEETLRWIYLVDEDLMKEGSVLKMGKKQKKEQLMKTPSVSWRLCVALFICSKDEMD
jgi:hypothetical protein